MSSAPSARTSHGGRSRVFRLGTLALFLLGQLLAGFHHALEPHTICSIDGQLAHGGHEHGGHEHGLAEDASSSHDSAHHDEDRGAEEGTEAFFDGQDEGHEHAEHCSVPRLSELRPVEPSTPGEIVRPDQLASRAVPARAREELPQFAIYLRAPKNSPPRGA